MTITIRKRRNKWVPLLTFAAILSGCATAPAEPQIEETDTATKVSAVRQQPEQHQDSEVVWGGSVIGIDNRAEETWIEIIERPLHRSGIPVVRDKSAGRFLAVVPGFLDPLEYSNGRSITINGIVSGSETRKIAEADYNYPIVAVVDHQLWSEAEARAIGNRYSGRKAYPRYGHSFPHFSKFGISYGSRRGLGLGFSFGHGFGHGGFKGGFKSGFRGRHRGGFRSRHRGGFRKRAFVSGRTRF